MTTKAEVFTYSDGITHLHLDNCSISITRTDEGVVVDVWEKHFEGPEPVASCWAHDSDLLPEICEETEE